jgi:hypothetical protein
MTTIQGMNLLSSLSALLLSSGANYGAVFGREHLDAFVLLILNVHREGAYVWQVFFGLHCLALGILVHRARFLPRILGGLMMLASIGYLTDSFGNFLVPAYAERFAWVVAATSFIGELPLFAWLLFRGVDVERWRELVALHRRGSVVGQDGGLLAP